MIGQERLHRAAQQRRIVARHRRYDQQLRLRPARRALEGALEMQEPAERPLPDAGDMHGNVFGADRHFIDAPFRPAITARGAFEQFGGGRDRLAVSGMRERIGGIFEKQPRGVGHRARGIERGLPHFVEPIHRRRQQQAALAGQPRCRVEFADRRRLTTLVFRHPRPLLRCGTVSLFRHIVNLAKGSFGSVYTRQIAGKAPATRRFSGYSPVCNKEPWTRALCSNLRKANDAAANRTTLKANASSIRSARKTWWMSSARMPSKT